MARKKLSYEELEAEDGRLRSDTNLGISFMCNAAGVSESGYRNWRDTPSAVAARHDRLAVDIDSVWRDSRCAYGPDWVHPELVRQTRRLGV